MSGAKNYRGKRLREPTASRPDPMSSAVVTSASPKEESAGIYSASVTILLCRGPTPPVPYPPFLESRSRSRSTPRRGQFELQDVDGSSNNPLELILFSPGFSFRPRSIGFSFLFVLIVSFLPLALIAFVGLLALTLVAVGSLLVSFDHLGILTLNGNYGSGTPLVARCSIYLSPGVVGSSLLPWVAGT